MSTLELAFACGESSLSVRTFSVHEAISTLFTISVRARSPAQDLDFEAIIGDAATFRVASGLAFATLGAVRTWTGVVSYIEQVQAEETGLATYDIRIVPALWLLTQRTNHRIFQHLSIPEIVREVLAGWSIAAVWVLDEGAYPPLEFKVQYGESDHAFVDRLCEEAGISYTFPDSVLTFGDALHAAPPRPAAPITFADNPNHTADEERVTLVRLSREVRPGAHAVRDHDFRNPALGLLGEATNALGGEGRLEQHHYRPGAFLVEGAQGGDTPAADDKGVARRDEAHGAKRAGRGLEADRAGGRAITFDSNAHDLAPGVIFTMAAHPHAALSEAARLLVVETTFEGSATGAHHLHARAFFADTPYRTPHRTPKPDVTGVQSATVVGPAGEEIHTDEFGRVRVQFPWDRAGKNDDGSSCWVRVSQGWAGVGYGMIMTPRIGHEVLVGFLGGDPDQPVVVGRVFNNTQRVPYKLPDHKTRSTWKSDSSPGSEGFNEIMFEDLAGKELIWIQAERDLRKLVIHDETITIGNDRSKLVKRNETEQVGGDRREATGRDRVEITDADRSTTIGGAAHRYVAGDVGERVDGAVRRYVGGDQHVIVNQTKRETVGGDSHITVKGDRRISVGGTYSITAGGLQVGVGKAGLAAKDEIHLSAGGTLVVEASDITLKAPGGFVRIDAAGVTIVGTMVLINSGGAAGSGSGAHPASPEPARDPDLPIAARPELDDVSKSRIGRA